MSSKKILILSSLFFICTSVYSQDYYISRTNDTLRCEIKKVYPRGIKIKSKEEGTRSFDANEIKGFVADGIPFTSKKILNSKKDQFIFIRADRGVPYGELMDVLEILRNGGYKMLKLTALEGVPGSTTPPAATDNSKP